MKLSNRNPTGVKQLAPANYGMAGIAQRRLDHVVNRANMEYLEALKVDGAKAIVWRRSSTGGQCSCQNNIKPKELPNEETPWETIKDDISPIGADDFGGGWGSLGATIVPRNGEYDVKRMGESSALDMGRVTALDSTLRMEDLVMADATLHALNSGLMPDVINSSFYNGCPICFGSGVNEAYQPRTGRRYIFDATDLYEANVEGVSVNAAESPFKFETDSNPAHYVKWTFQTPAWFLECARVRVMNGENPASGLRVMVGFSGSTTTPATTGFFNGLKGSSKEVEIRVSPLKAQLGQTLTWTHVELVYIFSWDVVAIGNINIVQDISMPGTHHSTEFSFHPSVGTLFTEDLVEEAKYGRLWLLTGVNTERTSSGQMFHVTGEGKTVATTNALYGLRGLLKAAPVQAYMGPAQLQNRNQWRR